MNEWLNEKAKEASADSPLTVKTENFDPILSNLNSPGTPSVRERTTSADASFGSAKKVMTYLTIYVNSTCFEHTETECFCIGDNFIATLK